MWRPASITLLCALTTAAPLEAAQSVKVRVVSSTDPAAGVRSAILTDAGGAMTLATRTDRAGVATLSVERCDDALGISADPVLPFLRSGRFDCAGELVIPVGLPDFAAALAPALTDVAAAQASVPPGGGTMNEAAMTTLWGSLLDRLHDLLATQADICPGPAGPEPTVAADPRAMLQQALAEQDNARAALAAATLAGGDPALAASYKALAATAAFRAIGLEAGDPAGPLMTAEGAAAVTTEAGKAAIAAFQAAAGVAVTGAWTPETLARLPAAQGQ